jgi:ABC-type phosphate transport system substrate-binding protein
MKTHFIAILSILFICISCQFKSDKDNTEQSTEPLSGDIHIVTSKPFHSLAEQWAQAFMAKSKNLQITVRETSPDSVLDKIKTGQYQMAMTCMNTIPEETAVSFWHVTAMKDGIIPITSEANPYLEKLLEQGIDKQKFINLFKTTNGLTWGEFLNNNAPEPVKLFRFEDIKISNDRRYPRLFEIESRSERELNHILEMVADEPYSLSFCSANHAYHCKKENKQPNLRIIPVDLDGNNKVDEKEKFYTRLDDLQRAQYLGIYPNELCREMVILSQQKPNQQHTIAFIDYLLHEGQRIAVDNGFARISNSQADNIMQQLALSK